MEKTQNTSSSDFHVFMAMFVILGAAMGCVLGYGLGHHQFDAVLVGGTVGAGLGLLLGSLVALLG